MATNKRLSRAEKRQIIIDTNFANKGEFAQELFCDYTILTFKVNYRDKIGYDLVIFEKRDVKPYIHNRFDSEELRHKKLKEYKEYYQKKHDAKEAETAALKAKMDAVKVGDIFCSSWGYEQTNIDFYIIVERKNNFVIVQQIGHNRVYLSGFNDRGTTTPNQDIKIGEPFRKRLTLFGFNINSYTSASPYDGKPKSWSSYA